ncbi:Dynactin subunit 4 [Paramyrothecium foliicola]|nr:Dynactin subunit 4 [Paramyrothecium foliicola]
MVLTMGQPTPYTYIQCPCSEQAVERADESPIDQTNDEELTFDPRAPRSNFSLYPLEYLLYCEDCQQIRCPRCVNEETVTYYCPNCLFEVPSSNLRSEGNRCTRSCYQCPVCVGPLQVGSVQPSSDAQLLAAEGNTHAAGVPFALFCQYCNWSSSEIGIEFDRPSGIHSQLSKLKNGGMPKLTAKDVKERRKEHPDGPPVPDELVDADLQFASLKSFYQSQLADTNASLGGLSLGDGAGFSSPAALTRIMSLYTGRGHHSSQQGPSDVMREALTTEEGLKLAQLDESEAIKTLTNDGWEETTSLQQRAAQLEHVRFQSDLRPVPYLLRTKRSKRCPVCRHIISKPEGKVASNRFKIRLVAKSYIPNITIAPLNPTARGVPVGSRPDIVEEAPLRPLNPYQYILTFTNPLFESIKITLATPSTTPGRFASRVTVLCPQFEVDANTDMWDDALKDDGQDRRRKGEENTGQAEPGKIWDRGRNWVSIVVEVIPASLRHPSGSETAGQGNKVVLQEDEDILEIPVFVRMEWEADSQNDMSSAPGKEKEAKEKRELAYCLVLGGTALRELEVDVAASETSVNLGVGVQAVVNATTLLLVEDDLEGLAAVLLGAETLANNLDGVGEVAEDGVVDSSQSARTGALLLLGVAGAGGALGAGQDAARGQDQDMAVRELLLELAGQATQEVSERRQKSGIENTYRCWTRWKPCREGTGTKMTIAFLPWPTSI